jgi:RNA polymerase sigma-70 factor (ECF subfamily)
MESTENRRYPLAVLYEAHHGWLRTWLRRRLGCADKAADIAHDTFLRVLSQSAPEPLHSPRAYLSTIAHGLVVSHWRRQDLERAYLEALAQQPELSAPSPETRALAIEALVAIDALLATLPERARRAFLMSQLDGLTYREIGAQIGVSERMVKKYMARAMLHCLNAVGQERP